LAAGEKILFKYNTRVNERDWEVTSDTVFTELFAAWGIADISLLKPAKDAFYSFFFTKTGVYPETESVLKELKKKKYQNRRALEYGLRRRQRIFNRHHPADQPIF